MGQQIINVGAAPNDGTGDPLRNAYSKCNENFTELYGGSFVRIIEIADVDSPYNVLAKDSVIHVTSVGTVIVNLPTLDDAYNKTTKVGRTVVVSNRGTGQVDVTAASGENINGQNEDVLAAQYNSGSYTPNSVEWAK